MKNQLNTLLTSLKSNATSFSEVIAHIEKYYQYVPTAFKNGDVYNEDNQNQGSVKVFSFAQKNNLNEEDTLHLFAAYYHAVLDTPNGTDHQNIRQFMIHGWQGIIFEGNALAERDL